MKTYVIAQAVHGELHLGPGPDATAYRYEAGEHRARNAAELAVLDHLVISGAATVRAVSTRKHKEALR